MILHLAPFCQSMTQYLTFSKLEEFADNNFNSDLNGRSFTNGRKALWKNEKLLNTSNFFFSHSVFKRFALKTCKSQGLFGRSLITLGILTVSGSVKYGL